ncbi:MAG: hypothetical protein ACOCXZ_03830 [Chloroflexota bacterium]
MSDIDDIRGLTGEEDDFWNDEDEIVGTEVSSQKRLFLGMTPLERMFISMFLFMNVAVLGIALLLATGRIGG